MAEAKKEASVSPTRLPPGLVGPTDLAEYYKVPVRTIQRAAAKGKIPGTHVVLGKYLFDYALAKEWVPHEAVLRAEFLDIQDKKNGHKFKKGDGGRQLKVPDPAIRFAQPAISKLPKRESALYHQALTARLSPENWIEIVDKAIEEAKAGGLDGHRARKWLGDYVLGRPIERVKAQLEMHVKHEYSQAQRATAITDMLRGIVGIKGDVIDVESRPVSEAEGLESDTPVEDADARPGPADATGT